MLGIGTSPASTWLGEPVAAVSMRPPSPHNPSRTNGVRTSIPTPVGLSSASPSSYRHVEVSTACSVSPGGKPVSRSPCLAHGTQSQVSVRVLAPLAQSGIDTGLQYSFDPETGARVRRVRPKREVELVDPRGLFRRTVTAYESSSSPCAAAAPERWDTSKPGTRSSPVLSLRPITALPGEGAFSRAVQSFSPSAAPAWPARNGQEAIARRVEPLESWSACLDTVHAGGPLPRAAWSLPGVLGKLPPGERRSLIARRLRISHRSQLSESLPTSALARHRLGWDTDRAYGDPAASASLSSADDLTPASADDRSVASWERDTWGMSTSDPRAGTGSLGGTLSSPRSQGKPCVPQKSLLR